MGFVRDALERRRIPAYIFARRVTARMGAAGHGAMSEHRLNKLLSGRIQTVSPHEIEHISAELVQLGIDSTPELVNEDIERARRDELEHLARTA